jgi:hypothetical protein
MREHYFCVRAIANNDGDLEFDIDHEVTDARFPEGAMFDTETKAWSLVSDEQSETDNLMVMELTARINKWLEWSIHEGVISLSE